MVAGVPKPPQTGLQRRLLVVGIALLVALLVLDLRLAQLQLVHWNTYKGQADSNRLRIQRLKPPRGMIFGHNGTESGVVLADNRASRDLVLVPAECDAPESVAHLLEQLIGIDGDGLIAKIQQHSNQPYTQIEVKQDLTRALLARIEEYSYALPGVFVVVRPVRRYIYGETAGQILGYLGEIGPEELDRTEARYFMGDLIGRSGLEKMYEPMLHGRYGQMLVTQYASGAPQVRTDAYGQPYIMVDSYGHPLDEERQLRQDPVHGRSLHISLDIGLQEKVEQLMEGERGAVAVLNAETGAVLALASVPNYDPGVFVTTGMDRERQEVLTAKPNRLINRAIHGQYAPGSIFKVILALAALEEGVITKNTTIYCPGRFRLSPRSRTWHCWRRIGHGEMNVVDALAFSCDVFFYHMGLELGVDRINAYSAKVSLGRKTGIDLPGEIAAGIDSRESKRERERELHPDDKTYWRWYDGDTVNLSIGQGGTTVTPLQGAVMMAAVLNGGRRVRPFLKEDRGLQRTNPQFKPEHLDIVIEGMAKCVEKGPPAPTGTGNEAHIPGVKVLGKTGSAQVMSLAHHEEFETEEEIPYEMRDHAWFVAGVANKQPKIAICILVEHGHHGSSEAAPLAKEIIEFFYSARGVPLRVAKSEEAS